MVWKIVIAFVSGMAIGGTIIGIADYQASKDAEEKFLQVVTEAYMKGVGRGIQAQEVTD